MRKTRKAFAGVAYGAALVIAQSGSTERVFKGSGGTGLAERFFMLAEPSPLGSRVIRDEFVSHAEESAFRKACIACLDKYSNKALSAGAVIQEPDVLEQPKLAPEGYQLLLDTRRNMEPRLGQLLRDGEVVMVGWLCKLETHVLKVAAVLHVVECLGSNCSVPQVIPTKLVQTALEFVRAMGGHLLHVLHGSGESGVLAEIDAVIELAARKPYTVRVLAQTLRRRHPFRAMGNQAYKRAQARIETMLQEGRLVMTPRMEVNPPVIYAKQANVTTGPQQINNGVAAAVAQARDIEIEQNQLEGEHDELLLDTRGTSQARRDGEAVEAVGKVYGTDHT